MDGLFDCRIFYARHGSNSDHVINVSEMKRKRKYSMTQEKRIGSRTNKPHRLRKEGGREDDDGIKMKKELDVIGLWDFQHDNFLNLHFVSILHLTCALLTLPFTSKTVQCFLALFDREFEFVCVHDVIALHC